MPPSASPQQSAPSASFHSCVNNAHQILGLNTLGKVRGKLLTQKGLDSREKIQKSPTLSLCPFYAVHRRYSCRDGSAVWSRNFARYPLSTRHAKYARTVPKLSRIGPNAPVIAFGAGICLR